MGIIEAALAQLDPEHATVRHRVAGIRSKVEHDLLHRSRIGADRANWVPRDHVKLDVFR